MEFDVLVAGGGSAGLAAAVAAARVGARTLLVERHGALGGMVSAALVHSICGLYRLPAKCESTPPALAHAGFAAEFSIRLLAAGGASGPVRMGRVDVLLQRPTAFAQLADQIVRETPRLNVRLHTELLAAEGESVTLLCRGQRESVRAAAFVDATGDAALAVLRGAPCEQADRARLQRPAFIFALAGVPAAALDDTARLQLAQLLARAVQAGALPADALGAHLRACAQEGEAFVTLDLDGGGAAYDPLDPHCLTQLETAGRALAGQLTDFLRRQVEGFAHSYVAAWPARVGVRESRRVMGRYRVEAADLERGAAFADAVAVSAWPMELRETARGPRWRFPTNGQPCDIPLRALQARDDAALFMAGRCLSCSHEAQAALRVIGTCLATGEAAGLAAGLQALGKPCDANAVNTARAQLSSRG
ncbi:MAG: FAD-dependent oxidoreductase [Verrucomicrobia bacterium]|nr:FAD-dependent oxidoreductase [Verrucomicrobiota bacterium]